MPLESSFDSRTQSIRDWVDEQRRHITENLALTEKRSEDHDMQVLRIFFRELKYRDYKKAARAKGWE